MKSLNNVVLELISFRKKMNIGLSFVDARRIWGRKFLKNFSKDTFSKEVNNIYVERKVGLVEDNLKLFMFLDWVKFVGVSGSVAAGFAKEDDDIDIFIVVRNGCSWLYRGILTIGNLFHNMFRAKRHGSDVKDKFCINLICEERDLVFDNDIFTFHELVFLIPVYNKDYLKYIFSKNVWMRDEFFLNNELMFSKRLEGRGVNIFFRVLNTLAFFFQLVFMKISNHNPEIGRLRRNFKRGRIEFFPEGYRKENMERYMINSGRETK